MTIVVDGSGTRWVEVPRTKRRRAPRALRFAEIKVGDQLVCRRKARWETYEKRPIQTANIDPLMRKHEKETITYAIVTDLWFDPVAGEEDPISGQMVAIRYLRDGEPVGNKWSHTRRGLATNSYHYADFDVIEHYRRLREGIEAGEVTGISKGKVYRRRPKLPPVRPL
jgi:hypothetical protein